MANPVNWFEIPALNLEELKGFYENVFEIEMNVSEMGGSLMAWFPGGPEGNGATGTLIQGEGYSPSPGAGSVVYFSVPSIDTTLQRIAQNGGSAMTPKISIGEFGWIAQFHDPQGNRVAIHEAPAG